MQLLAYRYNKTMATTTFGFIVAVAISHAKVVPVVPENLRFLSCFGYSYKIAVLIPGGYYNYLQVIADSAF